MALPTYVGRGNYLASGGSFTMSMPPEGDGVAPAIGDVWLAFFETANQAVTLTGGNQTWTEILNIGQGSGGGVSSTRLTVFWARLDTASPTAPLVSDSGDHTHGMTVAFRGCVATGNPYDVTSSGNDTVSNTAGVVTGATTTGPDRKVLAAIATSLPDATNFSNFSNWANADLSSITTHVGASYSGGNGGGISFISGDKAAAGAYGNSTVDLAAAALKSFATIALKPAVTSDTATMGVAAAAGVTPTVRADASTAAAVATGVAPAPRADATAGTAGATGAAPTAAAAVSSGAATGSGVTPTAQVTLTSTPGVATTLGVSPVATATAGVGTASAGGVAPLSAAYAGVGSATGQGVNVGASASLTRGTAAGVGIAPSDVAVTVIAGAVTAYASPGSRVRAADPGTITAATGGSA